MGRGYHLIARTPGEAVAILDRIGVAGAVVVRDRTRDAYPHSAILRHAVTGGGFRVVRQRYPQGDGEVVVAVRHDPIVASRAIVARRRIPQPEGDGAVTH